MKNYIKENIPQPNKLKAMKTETKEGKLSGFFHCDMAVRKDGSLSNISKLIFGDVAYFYFLREGKCIASNDFFANKYGKSNGTISKAISELEKRGYVERYLDQYKNRTLYIRRSKFSKENLSSSETRQGRTSNSIAQSQESIPPSSNKLYGKATSSDPDHLAHDSSKLIETIDKFLFDENTQHN